MTNISRRDFLKLPLALGAAGIRQASRAKPRQRVIDEYDPGNVKLSHRVPARISDDDLLFLKQIGIRWARVEFGNEEAPLEFIRTVQERYARYGIRIFSGVHHAYQSLNVQLGRPGRDKDIATFQTFLRDRKRHGML